VELSWDPRGTASAEVRVGFGELDQTKEVTGRRARFVFDPLSTQPTYYLVRLRDDAGDVVSAMGDLLPAAD